MLRRRHRISLAARTVVGDVPAPARSVGSSEAGSDLASHASILRALADSVPHRIYAKDAQGRFIFANQAVAAGMGAGSPDDLLGKTDFDFYSKESAQQYFNDEQGIIASRRPILNLEEHVKYVVTDTEAWMLTSKVPLRDASDRVVGIVGINYDISERKQMEQALETARQTAEEARDRLAQSENRYRHLVEELPDGLLVASEGLVVFANRAAVRLYAATTMAELVGRSLESLFVAPHSEGTATAAVDAVDPGGATDAVSSEREALQLNGCRTFVSTTCQQINLSGASAVQVVVRDVSARRLLESNLQYQATHDALTGLPNRALLTDRLKQALNDATRNAETFQVCLIDLDRFKWINDSLGHAAGDRLLRIVSARITACLRASDIAARLSGDEFVVLLRQSANEHDVVAITSRLAESISQPIHLGVEQSVTVTCSVGCSHFPGDASSAEDLIKCADAAMYRAKALGRNQVQFYNAELRRRIEERLHIESELRHALARGQLSLHYQPQMCLATGRIVGVEALLRWSHPELGNVVPERFISIAEESGMIVPIGAWVLETACARMTEWQRLGCAPAKVAVNISAKQFTQDDLAATIRRIVAVTGTEPSRLAIELTESASMEDPERSILLMQELKSLGVHLSIDDFGTGYSNMGYLRRFPVDQLKLDGSFIEDLDTDCGALAIVEAVVALSHRLGLEVVAERVETDQQVARLRACGCDFIQGFWFSKPLSTDECTRMLARQASACEPVSISRPASLPRLQRSPRLSDGRGAPAGDCASAEPEVLGARS